MRERESLWEALSEARNTIDTTTIAGDIDITNTTDITSTTDGIVSSKKDNSKEKLILIGGIDAAIVRYRSYADNCYIMTISINYYNCY